MWARTGCPHGTGTFVWANGDWYEGEFCAGEHHCTCTFFWADGS